MKNVYLLCLAVLFFVALRCQVGAEGLDILVADFEAYPNNLGGEMGLYGSLEPDWNDKNTPPSWYYDPKVAWYDPKNVHNGKQSFMLVNGLGTKPGETWGSVGIDLGPVMDPNAYPKKIAGIDVSKFKYLAFWVKGKKGGEHLEVIFRDSKAITYMPQVKRAVNDATTEWQRVAVSLDDVAGQVDLTSLVHIGVAFGSDVGNKKGDIVYIDDIVFTNNKE